MGLISIASAALALGKPIYRILSQTKQTVKLIDGEIEIPFFDRIEQAIIKAKEYGDTFKASGEEQRAKAASDVDKVIRLIVKKRGFKIKDQTLHAELLDSWMGTTYDIFENMEAGEDKVVKKE